ncbi:hypothetical protein EJ04DRAFT_189207 [Polyplosphaeria fusca]|uniref:Uncharacterized protein n=1 Tax=Polyplosphaeria fusca TaxID=682080 RepID=A0A9P4QIQ8_9PLEO|nr:hypothetical protein EJ04DRAFT_189207 [Polyplosphaeria fusca]
MLWPAIVLWLLVCIAAAVDPPLYVYMPTLRRRTDWFNNYMALYLPWFNYSFVHLHSSSEFSRGCFFLEPQASSVASDSTMYSITSTSYYDLDFYILGVATKAWVYK